MNLFGTKIWIWFLLYPTEILMVSASSCVGISLSHSFDRALEMEAMLSTMDTLGLIRPSTLTSIRLDIIWRENNIQCSYHKVVRLWTPCTKKFGLFMHWWSKVACIDEKYPILIKNVVPSSKHESFYMHCLSLLVKNLLPDSIIEALELQI